MDKFLQVVDIATKYGIAYFGALLVLLLVSAYF